MHPLSKIAARRLREEVEDTANRWGERSDIGSRISALRGEAQSFVSQVRGPEFDVFADDEDLHVLVDVPGYGSGDLELTVPEGGDVEELRVRGEREKPEGLRPLVEGRPSAFDCTIVLPEPCSTEGVSASLDNGVLVILLPRLERRKGKKIDIE